jgi:hypothetical protein
VGIFVGEAQAMSPKKGGATAGLDLTVIGKKACGQKAVKVPEGIPCRVKTPDGRWTSIAYCNSNAHDIHLYLGKNSREKAGEIKFLAEIHFNDFTVREKTEYCLSYEATILPNIDSANSIISYPDVRYPLNVKVRLFNNPSFEARPEEPSKKLFLIGEHVFKINLNSDDLKTLTTNGFRAEKIGTEVFAFPRGMGQVQSIEFEVLPIGGVGRADLPQSPYLKK